MEITYTSKLPFLAGVIFIIGLVIGMTLATWQKIRLLDLVLDPSGKLSGSRLWENIALAVGIWAFIYTVYTKAVTEFTWLIFLATYTGNKHLGNLLRSRYPVVPEKDKTDQSSS